MTTLPLPGLREDNPRDFLAALGLLGLLHLRWPKLGFRLAWPAPTSIPTISANARFPDNWSSELLANLQTLNKHPDQPLRHAKTIKCDPSLYRRSIESALEFQKLDIPLAGLPELLYASYSSQLCAEKSNDVHPSAFSFGNGQSGKNLLLDASQLLEALTPENLEASLDGTANPIAAKSLRWNPVEFRPAAHRGPDPGANTKGDDTLDFPAFNVLAFFGLIFFPSVPGAQGGLTAGFVRQNRATFFRWPIWDSPLAADSIRSLLSLPDEALLRRPGIHRTWKSRRFSSDKSLYFARTEPF